LTERPEQESRVPYFKVASWGWEDKEEIGKFFVERERAGKVVLVLFGKRFLKVQGTRKSDGSKFGETTSRSRLFGCVDDSTAARIL
jgi:hypothetical protein